MSNTTTITLADGTNATINHELFQEYRKRIFDQLASADAAKDEFKDEIEALAEAAKLPKALVSKYMKASYKANIKKVKEEAELFGQLDDIARS